MFKFLKEKIKGALSKISKSIEESPEDEIKKEFEKEEILEDIKTEKKEQKSENKEKKKKKHKKEKKHEDEIKEEPKIEKEFKEAELDNIETEEEKQIKYNKKVEEKSDFKEVELNNKEEKKEIQELIVKVEEKKGFFSRLKEKFTGKEETNLKENKIIEVEKPKEETEEKKSFFGVIKEKITTTKISGEKFENLFNDLELALLENNVAFEVVEKIKNDLKNNLVEKPIKRGEVEKTIIESLKESIEDLFLTPKINLIEKIKDKKESPYVIVFAGQNGSGKTTSIAKIANLLKENGISVTIAASDTFRAAAIQQIKEWGNKLNVKVIAHDYGSDPAAVAFDGIKYCQAHNINVLLIDTAGRQHSNKDLMREMEKIVRVAKPDLKIFVGESLVGSDAVLQAEDYNKSIGIDGIILTKSDVDEKGGAIISISYVTHRPIMYLGVGQNPNDLVEFDSRKVIEGLGL